MKLFAMSSSIIAVVISLGAVSVSAQHNLPTILMGSTWAPVYIFNNGVVDATKSCPAADWTQIQGVMTKAISDWQAAGGGKRNRQVRQLNRVLHSKGQKRKLQKSSGQQQQQQQRKLGGNCKHCHNNPLCIYYSGTGCPKTGGGGRRLTVQDDNERNLQTTAASTKCNGGITKVDAALNTLKPKLTPSCQALLNAPRQVVCTEYTTDCSINGFTVVKNSNGEHVTDIVLTGTTPSSFCSSVGEINIDTKTNFVEGVVMLDLTGPVSKSNTTPFAPFTVWAKNKGVKLSPGTYTIKGTSIVGSMGINNKQATFIVKSC